MDKKSVLEKHPDLVKEWHPTKNGGLTPDQVSFGSSKKVWWKCGKDPSHEWETAPKERTRKSGSRGCPDCNVVSRSDIELLLAHEILFFLDFSVDDICMDDELSRYTVDMKISDLGLIIEYDGYYWHKSNESRRSDRKKTELLIKHGWKVIRVRFEENGRITDDDILLSSEGDMDNVKIVADHVLCKLSQLGYVDHETYKDYKSRKDLINADNAKRYIEKLEREQNISGPQLEFYF